MKGMHIPRWARPRRRWCRAARRPRPQATHIMLECCQLPEALLFSGACSRPRKPMTHITRPGRKKPCKSLATTKHRGEGLDPDRRSYRQASQPPSDHGRRQSVSTATDHVYVVMNTKADRPHERTLPRDRERGQQGRGRVIAQEELARYHRREETVNSRTISQSCLWPRRRGLLAARSSVTPPPCAPFSQSATDRQFASQVETII